MKKGQPLKRSQKPLKRSPLKSAGKKAINKTPLKNKGNHLKKSGLKKSEANKSRKRNLKRKQIRRESNSPLAREIKLCDKFFSQYVRLSNADKYGVVKCFTCESVDYWQRASIEDGHFKGRGAMNTRWMKKNNEPQCKFCNDWLGGNLEVFAERLVLKHGKGILEYLDRESKIPVQLSVEKVKKLRTYFEGEVLKLKQKLNL